MQIEIVTGKYTMAGSGATLLRPEPLGGGLELKLMRQGLGLELPWISSPNL